MAITINNFEVSADRLSINLAITVAVGKVVNDIKLWNEDTFKITTDAVDLNSLIAGTDETENITISAAIAGVTSFDGIYFAEIASDDVADLPGMVGTVSLSQWYATMSSLVANVDLSCLNCNTNFQNALLLDLYIEGMKNSILLGRFRDAIEFHKKIIITVTSDSCVDCANITPVVSTVGNLVSIGVIDCQINLL